MKRLLFSLMLTGVLSGKALAFCGFYVAKADATLFNKASQVIIARDGNHSTITMFSDYQGPMKEFAMVVPVPVVLRQDQIKTVHKSIFERLDAYTGPRLVEYNDPSPCPRLYEYPAMANRRSMSVEASADWQAPQKEERDKKYQVKVEARYEVDEYEILILSAKESDGLERWLTDNGYKIPAGAGEVLRPYINNGMKFFVAKVNLQKLDANGNTTLNPLQISFDSPIFALPIRLGMANSTGEQDLIVYALTRSGRVETVNYRTSEMPTNRDIPEFISKDFGKFYQDTYTKAWKREDKTSVLVEYAWNIMGQAPVKCDPCPETANGPLTSLSYEELVKVGVNWITSNGWNPNPWTAGGTSYMGPLFITRLHARYNRELYPQDLVFQETQNRQNFQCRYVMHHPSNELDCEQAQPYLENLVVRRQKEIMEMAYLSGWDPSDYGYYVKMYRQKIKGQNSDDDSRNLIPIKFNPGGNGPGGGFTLIWIAAFVLATGLVLKIPSRRKA